MPKLQGYFNQTYAVEFEVPGDLDGITLSPEISATVPAAKDPQSLYRPTVVTSENPDGNLGLIDVDYLVTEGDDRLGSHGNRYVAWIWIEAAAPGAVGAVLEVVDAVDGSVAVQKTIANLAGQSTFYLDTGILVPQGSLLRLSGFTGGAKVRLHIAGLTDEGLLAVQTALCLCAGNGSVECGGVGPYTVGPDGTDACFSTINDALTQLLIDTPTPTRLNPRTIYIQPGTYDESVTLTKPWIHLVALNQSRGFSTVVTGALTLTNGAPVIDDLFENVWNVTGITFNGGFNFTGSNIQQAFVTGCTFQGAPSSVSNTGVDGSARTSQIVGVNTRWSNGVAATATMSQSASRLACSQCDFIHSDNTDLAYDQTGGVLTTQGGEVQGRAVHDGGGSIVPARWWKTTHNSGSAATFEIRSLAAVQIEQVAIVSVAAVHIIGSLVGGVTVADVRTFPGPTVIQSGGGLVVVDETVHGIIDYAAAVPANWAVPAPVTVQEGLDRLAAANPGA